jgi:acetyl esterase/lipase
MVPNELGTGLTIARAIESFSDLTLKGSELHPVAPLLGSRETTPDFIRELWQVRWRPNDPIDLWVIRPRGVKNPPVVLYLYGYPSETARFRNIEYCKRVVRGGAAAVGFVSALTGHRTEFRPMKDNFLTLMPEAVASTVHDIQMILNYLETRGDLDMSRVGIFGQGSGGSIAILTASVEPRLKVLDLLDPWGDWPEWFAGEQGIRPIERAGYLKPEFQKPLEPLEPVHALPQLKSQKIRIQFDPGTGEAKAAVDKLAAAAPANAEVIRFPDSQMMYNANSNGRLFEWMAKQLDAHPAPPEMPKAAAVQAGPAKPDSAPAPSAAAKLNP